MPRLKILIKLFVFVLIVFFEKLVLAFKNFGLELNRSTMDAEPLGDKANPMAIIQCDIGAKLKIVLKEETKDLIFEFLEKQLLDAEMNKKVATPVLEAVENWLKGEKLIRQLVLQNM